MSRRPAAWRVRRASRVMDRAVAQGNTYPPAEHVGMVKRARLAIVRRHLSRLLDHPAARPVVAGVVVLALAAVVLGALVGGAIVAAERGDGAL